jgi:hypothetical protein
MSAKVVDLWNRVAMILAGDNRDEIPSHGDERTA